MNLFKQIYLLRKLLLVVASLVLSVSSAQAGLTFIHTDKMGTPQALTNANQTVVWKADIQPYGEAVINKDPDGNGHLTEMPIRYPGQYHDEDTGLYYNIFRYYDPKLGQYITKDPIGIAGGLNLYAYAGGDPVSNTDAEGLAPNRLGTTGNSNSTVGVRIDFVIQQIRRIDPGFRYQAILPRNEGYRKQHLEELENILWGYRTYNPRVPRQCTSENPTGGVYGLYRPGAAEPSYVGMTYDFNIRNEQHQTNPRFVGLEMRILYYSNSYSQQRGAEQIYYEIFNPPLNRQNPISPQNPRKDFYKASVDLP